jgi:hypothetical protein
LRLEISVDDSVRVEEVDAAQDLPDDVLGEEAKTRLRHCSAAAHFSTEKEEETNKEQKEEEDQDLVRSMRVW